MLHTRGKRLKWPVLRRHFSSLATTRSPGEHAGTQTAEGSGPGVFQRDALTQTLEQLGMKPRPNYHRSRSRSSATAAKLQQCRSFQESLKNSFLRVLRKYPHVVFLPAHHESRVTAPTRCPHSLCLWIYYPFTSCILRMTINRRARACAAS